MNARICVLVAVACVLPVAAAAQQLPSSDRKPALTRKENWGLSLGLDLISARFQPTRCSTVGTLPHGTQGEVMGSCDGVGQAYSTRGYGIGLNVSDEVLDRVGSLGTLIPFEGPARGNGPAAYCKLDGARGSIGVITPMTHTYCASCNRVRLTADGRLRTCLFGDHEVDLRSPLRRNEPLHDHFVRALENKPKEHELLNLKVGGLRALSEVGG